MQPLTQIRLSLPVAALLLWVIDCAYQLGVRHTRWDEGLLTAAVEAALYLGVLWASIRPDLSRTTLLFLATPYLIFMPGWLNLPTTIITLPIFLYCTYAAWQSMKPVKDSNHAASFISLNDFNTFLIIAMLVNLSGAGGYGFQWDDYNMHNARLKDLAEMPWPVRYGENQNFVYYFGYFLPGALIGKITSLEFAFRTMYFWTLLGTVLALRWLSHLSKWKFSPALVLIFIVFGPYDILNVLITSDDEITSLKELFTTLAFYSDQLNFNLSYQFNFFIGNYLSNLFNLFWSPQQVIAGWLAVGLLLHLHNEKRYDAFLFIYALLCLWAPLVMIAILPLIFITMIHQTTTNIYSILTIPNIIGSFSLAVIFITFYIGGSANSNPSFWIFDRLTSNADWKHLFLLYFTGWGIYTLAIIPFIAKQPNATKHLFFFLIISLIILPWRTFGEWGDLLCRGSSPLMFLLLIFLLQAIHHHWHSGRKNIAALMLCLLIPGSLSSVILNASALANYGRTQPIASIITYPNAYPNLGPDNTLFNRWFRRQIPEKNESLAE
jgi:hypothetical protein